MVVNVWRGTDRFPMEGRLLALCDQRSMDERDLFHVPFLPPPEDAGGYELEKKAKGIRRDSTYTVMRFNEDQRWYYLSDMQPEENLLLKTFDSADPRSTAQGAVHCAFDHPGTIGTGKSRRSVETRCVLIFHP